MDALNNYNYQEINDAVSEHDVFLILSGTKVTASSSGVYSQNLPFAATFTADNVASFSQNVYSCTSGTQQNFQMNITNSKFSSYNINKLVLNATGFTVSTPVPAPVGWTSTYSSGMITWSTSGTGIAIGSTLPFSWTGTAPTVTTGAQYTFPAYVTFTNGQITSQSVTTGCYVGV